MSEIPREEQLPEFCTSDNFINATEEDLRALAEIAAYAKCTKRGRYLYFKSGEAGRTWKIFVTETGKLYLANKERVHDIAVLTGRINKVKTRDRLVGQFRGILDKHLTETGGIESASVILDSGEEQKLKV